MWWFSQAQMPTNHIKSLYKSQKHQNIVKQSIWYISFLFHLLSSRWSILVAPLSFKLGTYKILLLKIKCLSNVSLCQPLIILKKQKHVNFSNFNIFIFITIINTIYNRLRLHMFIIFHNIIIFLKQTLCFLHI